MHMLYDDIKLVRFTGVPLTNRWSVETTLIKTNSGLKQTNVPQGWARISAEPVVRPVSLWLALVLTFIEFVV